jgi:hypothetical protein
VLAALFLLTVSASSPGAVVTTGNILFSTQFGDPGGGAFHGSESLLGVTFFVDAFAGANNTTVTNTSQLQAEYSGVLTSPGTANIKFSQIPIASSVQRIGGFFGEIGARARDPIFGLPISVSVPVGFGAESTGAGDGELESFTGTGSGLASPPPSFGIPFVLEAGASLEMVFNDTVDFNELVGRLFVQYTPPGGTPMDIGEVDFNINSTSTPGEVNVNLSLPGIYDFDLAGPTILGTYDGLTRINAQVFAEIFGNNIPVFRIPLDSESVSGPITLESNILVDNWFSIEVRQEQEGVVPEPASGVLWLTLAAVSGIWRCRRWVADCPVHHSRAESNWLRY